MFLKVMLGLSAANNSSPNLSSEGTTEGPAALKFQPAALKFQPAALKFQPAKIIETKCSPTKCYCKIKIVVWMSSAF